MPFLSGFLRDFPAVYPSITAFSGLRVAAPAGSSFYRFLELTLEILEAPVSANVDEYRRGEVVQPRLSINSSRSARIKALSHLKGQDLCMRVYR